LSVICPEPACELPSLGELFCGDSVIGDTSDAGAEDVAGPNGGIGNWYTFIGTGQDMVVLSTCDTADYDTRITIFTDCGETQVADNDDDFANCGGFTSQVSFFAELDVEYNVFMRGFLSDTGNYELSVICPIPPCELPSLGELFCGDTVFGDTSDAGAEDVAGPNGGIGNWYTFTGTGDDMTVFSTCNTADYDTRITIFTDCGETQVADNDDGSGCSGFSSEVAFFAEDGDVYNIFMRGFLSDTGNYELNVSCNSVLRQSELAQEDVKIDFTAYPVPFDKEVNIAYSFEFETKVTIELFDTKGLLILTENNNNYVAGSKGRSTFDLSRISNQMFYVKLTTNQGSVTKKIVSSGKK